jgi:branched-chain amino acid transport system ATP-binding protein
MLRVERVSGGYAHVPVLEDVSCELAEGEIVAIFGHNGAGKSTLLKLLFGLLRGVAGKVELDGADLTRRTPREHTRAGMAYVPQEQGVFPRLTVGENLRMGLWARSGAGDGDEATAFDEVFRYLPILRERWSAHAGDLSGGQQQMLSIARALVTRPRLLMLDEPSTGLAPTLVKDVMELVKRIKDEGGVSVLLVEQNVAAALAIADRAYLMKSGRIIRAARPEELYDAATLWSLF